MKKYFEVLETNPLFKEIEVENLEKLLHCLSGKTTTYKKNDFILLWGDPVLFLGIVLTGSVKIIKEDLAGNINILATLGVNEVFAEALACTGIKESPVSVQAEEESEILFIDCRRIITSCSAACEFHTRLIENLLGLMAKKNIMLNQKIEILSKRTTREKLWMFFEIHSRMSNSKRFLIPYNREALAHYLGVDRSAMSRELCLMRDEGFIKFNKNEFEILKFLM